MTAPAPTPPLVVRARLRLRWARRRARYAAARHLRRLVALLDPPPEHIERARVDHYRAGGIVINLDPPPRPPRDPDPRLIRREPRP